MKKMEDGFKEFLKAVAFVGAFALTAALILGAPLLEALTWAAGLALFFCLFAIATAR